MSENTDAVGHGHLHHWLSMVLAHRRAGTELYQSSTMNALLAGVYDGDLTIAELLEHGDFGLGTFNHLDGEMVVLDGTCHHLRSDGTAVVAAPTEETPFAAVTRFHADSVVAVDDPMGWADVTGRIDSMIDSVNLMYAIRIDGVFGTVSTRTVKEQAAPYPPLVEATAGQAQMQFTDIAGTLAGFRMPDYDQGISVAGYHLHFLADDHARGGHALDFQMRHGAIRIGTISDLHLRIPRTAGFLDAQLSGTDSSEQIRRTEGGH